MGKNKKKRSWRYLTYYVNYGKKTIARKIDLVELFFGCFLVCIFILLITLPTVVGFSNIMSSWVNGNVILLIINLIIFYTAIPAIQLLYFIFIISLLDKQRPFTESFIANIDGFLRIFEKKK